MNKTKLKNILIHLQKVYGYKWLQKVFAHHCTYLRVS